MVVTLIGPITSSYSASQLCSLVSILKAQTSDVKIVKSELERDLLDLMAAVGKMDDGSEEAAWYREAGQDDISHVELAIQFQQIAEAEDPLDASICHGVAFAELHAASRRSWTGRQRREQVIRPQSLVGITSDMLSPETIEEIRLISINLAQYHQSIVRAGAPNKVDQDTLLGGIADIFIRFAKIDCHTYNLPYSKNSKFIKFACRAMRPFFAQTEASAKALSNRWKRLKDAHSSFSG